MTSLQAMWLLDVRELAAKPDKTIVKVRETGRVPRVTRKTHKNGELNKKNRRTSR